MADEQLNCWINWFGDVHPVRQGYHEVDRGKINRPAIRVSTPEGRRTWTGIELGPRTSTASLQKLRTLIRQLRGSGIIIEDVRPESVGYVDCQPGERSDNVYRFINKRTEAIRKASDAAATEKTLQKRLASR